MQNHCTIQTANSPQVSPQDSPEMGELPRFFSLTETIEYAMGAERRAFQNALNRMMWLISDGACIDDWPGMLAEAIGRVADETDKPADVLFACAWALMTAACEREELED